MSKSLGNLVFVSELLKVADPRAIRLALMAHHYRDDWEWFDEHIDDGDAVLALLHAAAHHEGRGPDPQPYAAEVRAALDDDLDAPRARRALVALAEAILVDDAPVRLDAARGLRDLAMICGIDLSRPRSLA
jgi:L-cysteine:1D-myo-inositol 2-amino-2-deoxy-alpha-D-glucopyranoside ligase